MDIPKNSISKELDSNDMPKIVMSVAKEPNSANNSISDETLTVSEKKDEKKCKKEEKGDNENLGALIANIGYLLNATSSLFIAILFRINDNVVGE